MKPTHTFHMTRLHEPDHKHTVRILFLDGSYKDVKNTYELYMHDEVFKIKYCYKNSEKDYFDVMEEYYDSHQIKSFEMID